MIAPSPEASPTAVRWTSTRDYKQLIAREAAACRETGGARALMRWEKWFFRGHDATGLSAAEGPFARPV